MISGG
jgi:hypothetical protein